MSKTEEFDESQPGENIYDLASDAFEIGDYPEAERLLKIVLSDHDLLPEWRLRFEIGYCQLGSNKLSEATENLKSAYKKINRSETGGSFVEISTQLARIYLRLDKSRKALNYLKDAKDYLHHLTIPDGAFPRYEYYRYLGCAYSSIGRFAEAAKSFDTAVHILRTEMPDEKDLRCEATLWQAASYLRSKDMEKAVEILRSIQAAELNKPNLISYRCIMIEYYESLKPPDNKNIIEQFEFLREVGIEDDDKPEVFNSAARAYYNLGDRKKAKELFIESLKYPTDIKWMRKNNKAYLKLIYDKDNAKKEGWKFF